MTPNDYEKNGQIIYKYFKDKYDRRTKSLVKVDERRNYFLDEIKHNDLLSEEYKKTCKYLNYIEHLLILVSTITGFVLIYAFAFLVCVPAGFHVLQ